MSNRDGSHKLRPTPTLAPNRRPGWTIDSQWIACRSGRGRSWDIYILCATGSDLRKVIDANGLPLWFFAKRDWRQ